LVSRKDAISMQGVVA